MGVENTDSALGTPVDEPLGVVEFTRGGSILVFGGEVVSVFLPQAAIVSMIKLKKTRWGKEDIIRSFSHGATFVS